MKKVLCLIAGFLSVYYCSSSSRCAPDNEADFQSRLRTFGQDVVKLLRPYYYLHDAPEPRNLEQMLRNLNIDDIPRLKVLNNCNTIMICQGCRMAIALIQLNSLTVKMLGTALCNLISHIKTMTLDNFCERIINLNKPTLEYILNNSKILTPQYACSVILQNENCYYSHPALTWRTKIPEGGPPLLAPHSSGKHWRSSAPIKILYLSDVHISHDYEIGGIANCGYPICCKKGIGTPIFVQKAGRWGDYECDVPPWLFLNTLQHINNTHKDIDLIYFTGDIIDHAVWRGSHESNKVEISYIFDELAKSFPNVTVLPCIGNHESIPINIFAPHINQEQLSQKWLYELNAKLWSRWLPSETLGTVAKQGYYSVLAKKRFRIIVLNNNICYKYNWWLLYDTHFLKEQIEFLKSELLDAESKGQFVHILAHIFPGEKECIEPWEVNYNSLITRFAHIIKGQFFGHTHGDGLKVFYSKIDGKPNNVAFNGASLTPYTKNNPNYKIISVDPDTFDVLDIDTYTFNLTEANLYPDRTPRWKKLYSLKGDYSLSDLSPKNIDWLARQISREKNYFDKYFRFYVREGDASLKDGCDSTCRKNMISSITRVESLTSH